MLIAKPVNLTMPYCLNPDRVWKSFNNKKQYASFNTRTLARKEDNNEINRNLKIIMKEVELQKKADINQLDKRSGPDWVLRSLLETGKVRREAHARHDSEK